MTDQTITSTTHDEDQLFNIIASQGLIQGIRVVTDFQIPELLANGPHTINQLAEKTDVNETMLYRLMRFMAVNGIFEETAPGTFINSGTSNLLRPEVPHSMYHLMRMDSMKGFMAKTFNHLGEGIKQGEPPFTISHDGMTLWQYFMEVDPGATQQFIAAATSYTGLFNEGIVDALNDLDISVVADIGGNDGQLLFSLLQKNPYRTGVLFDRPDVIDTVSKHLVKSELTERCTLQGGNFFEAVPSGVDTYLLCHILHDWNDECSTQILSSCRTASPDAKVLIVERVIEADGSTHPYTLAMDLWMMLLFKDAKERTESEYNRLLEASGYRLNRRIRTNTPFSILEAIPA